MFADLPPLALFLTGLALGVLLGRVGYRGPTRYYPLSWRARIVAAQTWLTWAVRWVRGRG